MKHNYTQSLCCPSRVCARSSGGDDRRAKKKCVLQLRLIQDTFWSAPNSNGYTFQLCVLSNALQFILQRGANGCIYISFLAFDFYNRSFPDLLSGSLTTSAEVLSRDEEERAWLQTGASSSYLYSYSLTITSLQ